MSAGAIYFGSALLLALIGVTLVVWALFADRAKGRRRCPKCWYDMSAAVNLRCPECGWEVKHEKQLLKTRRRWKVAFATLLPFALAGVLAVQPKVQRDGWWSVMPTTLMLLYFQFQQDDAVIAAIDRRMSEEHVHPAMGTPMFVPEEGRLYRWQWQWLARQTARALEGEELTIVGRHTCIGWAAFCRDILDNDDLRGRLQQAIAAQLADEHTIIRTTAAIYGVDVRDPLGTIALMLPLVDDEDDRVQGAGAAALRILALKTNHDEAVIALIDLLEHPRVVVRDLAASALYSVVTYAHESRRDEVEEALRKAHVRSLEKGGLRHRIVSSLARFTGAEEWLPIVRESIESGDPAVRAEALSFISDGHVDGDEFMEAVLRELRSEDATPLGRLAAAWALRAHMSDDVLRSHEDEIAALLDHPHPETRGAALAVFIRLDPTRTPEYADYP